MKPYLPALVLMSLAAHAAAAAELSGQLTVYEMADSQVLPKGASTSLNVVRPQSTDIQTLLQESFPGKKAKLLTFPTFDMTSGKPFHLDMKGLGRFEMDVSPRGGLWRLTLGTQVRDVAMEPVLADLSPWGAPRGSSWEAKE